MAATREQSCLKLTFVLLVPSVSSGQISAETGYTNSNCVGAVRSDRFVQISDPSGVRSTKAASMYM